MKSLDLKDKKKGEVKQRRSDLKLKLTDSQAEMVSMQYILQRVMYGACVGEEGMGAWLYGRSAL